MTTAPRFALVSAPNCLGIAQMQFVSGPRGIGSGANSLVSGADQTFSTVGALWRISVPLVQAQDQRARRQRGLVTAIGDGAVAMRLALPDKDRVSLGDAGVVGPTAPQDWSRRVAWGGGVKWRVSHPLVPVATAAATGATRIRLVDQVWGHRLMPGDFVGFCPFYFGWHMVTRVDGPGTYTIWPELRRGLTTAMFATLTPTATFRAVPGAFGWDRDIVVQSGASLQLLEVTDRDARAWHDDTPSARSPLRPSGEALSGQTIRLWGDAGNGDLRLWGDEYGPVLLWGHDE